MGEVYLAEDMLLDRKVALKFLSESTERDPMAGKRFQNEAKSAAGLDHPFVCKIYETGEFDGKAFIAMEYVAGENLQERFVRKPLTSKEALRIATEVAEALEEAHSKGIVHRDLKPANIMLTPQQHAKVMDFGLAKRVLIGGDQEQTQTGEVTQQGLILGSVPYMSPEQARGGKVDSRSDIFSFGILLYEMVSGQHPFKKSSAMDTMSAILRDEPTPFEAEVQSKNPELRRILNRALAKNPDDRYQSTQDLVNDLKLLSEETVTREPSEEAGPVSAKWPRLWIRVGVAVAVLAVVSAGIISFLHRNPSVETSATGKAVSVLIADFQNSTTDRVFDGMLEQAFTIALEEAPFITTYRRDQARNVANQLKPDVKNLDQALAQLVAVREGIDVVIGGSITHAQGYKIAVRVIDTASSKTIVTKETEAGQKEGVLAAVAKLTASVRSALGDVTPESAQLAAAETFTAGSLEGARAYTLAQELQLAGKYDEAIRSYNQAVQLEPNLGRAYAGLAVASANLGQREEAKKYYQMALQRIDRMTEREKYRTRGAYYMLIGNPQKTVEELGALVKQYPSDTSGHANLALAYFYLRDFSNALQHGRKYVETYPNNVPQRNNLAFFALYGGDFEGANREAEAVLKLNPSYRKRYVVQALAQLAQGRPAEAAETYRRLEALNPRGASLAASGLADLALYEGRFAQATGILEKGVAGDLENKNTSERAAKLVVMAHIDLAGGRKSQALEAAKLAVEASTEPGVLFFAARIYIEADQQAKALALASEFGKRLDQDSQAYAKLIEGEALLKRGNAREGLRVFQEAQKSADTWLGRFDVGRAYLEMGAFAEAYSEFSLCLKRRGEAVAAFLDDIPTYSLFPPVYYYLGRAQEGLKSPAAAESYRTFISIKEKGEADPLVLDARNRLRKI